MSGDEVLFGFALGAITAGVVAFGVALSGVADERLPACQTPLAVTAVTR